MQQEPEELSPPLHITPLKALFVRFKQTVLAVVAFSAAMNLLMLVPAFYMLNVYDKAVANNSIPTLVTLSLVTGVMFCALGLLDWSRGRLLVAASARLDQLLGGLMHRFCFDNAVRVGPDRASTSPLTDLGALRQFMTGMGAFALMDVPWIPIYVVVLFLFHPLLGWMGALSVLGFLGLALAQSKMTNANLAESNRLSSLIAERTRTQLRNAEVSQVLGMTPVLSDHYRVDQDEVLSAQAVASETAVAFSAIIKALRLAVQSAAIGAGAYLVLKQEISPGMIIAGSILIGRALQPVDLFINAWSGLAAAKIQYAKLASIISDHGAPEPKSLVLPSITGELELNNASVAPPLLKTPLLKDVNIKIEPGHVCMVVGPSGAGKSTLVRGILGLWPTLEGTIRLNGAEINQYDQQELAAQVGYLPQSIELFDGTVGANISRFTDFDSTDVMLAASDAGVHEFILALPEGYETKLGTAGIMLSPGQRQRIALARALYLRPKLVVLDEPNSNLDEQGEEALNNAVEILKNNGSTVVLVSHRKGVLPLVDLLAVVVEGTITQFGPPSELLGTQAAPQSPASVYSAPRLEKPASQTVPIKLPNP